MKKYINQFGENLFTAQLALENKYKKIGEERIRTMYDKVTYDDKTPAAETKLGQNLLSHEFEHVKQAVHTYVEEILKPKRGTKPTYVSLIETMKEAFTTTEKVADVMTLSAFGIMFSASLRKEVHNSNLSRLIGDELEHETRLQIFLNTSPEEGGKALQGVEKRVQALYKQAYLSACYQRAEFQTTPWNRQDKLQLAACLIQIICKAGSYFEENTAEGDLTIAPSQKLIEAWSKNVDVLVSRAFTYCPTIVPPKPWTSFIEGGYYGDLASKAFLLRVFSSTSTFRKEYLQRLSEVDLSSVLNAVNTIQETPWKINQEVYQVAQNIVEQGGGRAGIPLMEEAAPPAVLPLNPSESEIQAYKKIMVGHYRTETRRNSIRLRVIAALRTAAEFKKYDRFYIPHNMDFRGRIYPIPSFNFQGDDLMKGLLLFADTPKIPSDSLLRYFYIEGANRAGIDKVSFEDRIKWVKDHEEHILSSAQDPLGFPWWQDQDCPFQFLAFCFDYKRLKDYLSMNNGSAEGFQTGIVISFDGTCSGLQHFSAALRDPVGGQAVNLLPSEAPSDIYRIVAEKVTKAVEEDCLNGSENEMTQDKNGEEYLKYGTKHLGLLWNTYGITRKVTKRSVMTLAYGSKEYGFADQLKEDIIKPDIDLKGEASVFQGCQGQAARYLAKHIWKAVQTTVVAAVQGMEWMQKCASIVAGEGKVVSWMTPAGLPVQQHYLEKTTKTIQLRCAGKRLRLYMPEIKGNVDKVHQRSGIAPNFIHSLDAAHLQLTCETCRDNGLTHYAMVHDSYGTCLANAHIMFRVVREEFVNMYESCDVFENLKEDLQILTTKPLPQPPSKGTLDLQAVINSNYIFC